MKTTHRDMEGTPANGEGIVSEIPPNDNAEIASGGDATIQAKDNEVQDSPKNASPKEYNVKSEAIAEPNKTLGSENNTARENELSDKVEQQLDLEKVNGSESIKETKNESTDNISPPNSQTGFTPTKEAKHEETNEDKPGPELEGPKEVSDIIPPPLPPDLNEDKNSLSEVDSHMNEFVNNLNGRNDTEDDVDKSVRAPNNLELKDMPSGPQMPKETEDMNGSNQQSGAEEILQTAQEVGKNLMVKDFANVVNNSSNDFNPKEVSTPIFKETNNLEVKASPVNVMNASPKNLRREQIPAPFSNEAYDNPGFLGDEVAIRVNVPSANVDGTPVRAVSSDPGAGNTKLPRRVSFSELPPKAMYDNFCGDGKDGGENGKVQPDLGNGGGKADGQEFDVLALYGPGEKWRILRNVVLISAAFMILFTAFFGAANLQSSVNSKAGLGTASLTTLYGALVVSNIFLPVTVIRWLRCKWTVAIMALGFAPYAMAQYHAEFYTLIPTALLAGLGAAPMWCAKCTYLNVAADAYAKVTGSAPELVMVRFFGVFYVLFPLGHVWGNLISSEVLSRGTEEDSINITVDVASLCGANYCPGLGVTENPNLQRPPDYQINTIASIFVACSLLAVVLVALGVDSLKRYNEGGRADSGTGLSGLELLIATARLLVNKNQIALIPITAFIGVSQAFLGADFTEGYISCAWGIPHIGYVLIGYGLASSVASVFVSWVVKAAGRLLVICSSITLFLILVTVMKFWQPSADQGVVFFTLAALWGLADSTALVINAMYGLLFRGNEAAAYSNFSLWGSAGFIVTYSYSPYLCMNTKLAILTVILILAMAGFLYAELALRRIIRSQQEEEQAKKKVQVS